MPSALAEIGRFSEAGGRGEFLFFLTSTHFRDLLARQGAGWPENFLGSVARKLGRQTEYWIRKHPQTHGRSTRPRFSLTTALPPEIQPTKRNRFDSRRSFAPEIAARTPPSVPWTFPCLCVGFTSFLSTAPSAAPRSALEVIWLIFRTRKPAHPHPRQLAAAYNTFRLSVLISKSPVTFCCSCHPTPLSCLECR